ncbi:MAG: hypothetical protein ACJ761_03845 [Chloroflexota bacterium]
MVRRKARPLLAALAALLAASFAILSPVAAASLPPGVVADGTITVTVTRAQADGAGPLADADVTVNVRASDIPEDDPIWSANGTSDADGHATFTGVPRPVDASVVLGVSAIVEGQTVETDANGCTTTVTWEGTGNADSEVAVELPVVALPVGAAKTTCPDPVLHGTIVDQHGDAFTVLKGAVSQVPPGGGDPFEFPLKVASDGSFDVTLKAIGTEDAPSRVEVTAWGAVTRTAPGDDPACTDQFGPLATATYDLALADGKDPEAVRIEAVEILVGTVCSDVGTPRPSATARATPKPTLPPTDAVGGTPSGGSGTGAGLVALGIACLLAAGTAIRRRRVSRGGS